MNTLKVFTAFSGYDSQCMALDRLGINYELFGWSEIDKYAIQAHNAVYPQYADRNYGDISKIDWMKVPDFELFTYSFPCFVKGTLILTENGYKPIENISIYDKVLTHTNSFKKVLQPMVKPYIGDLYTINAMCFHTLQCTEEHPFYVREKYRYGHKSIRMFKNPEWIKAKDLSKKYYLGYAVNQKSEFPTWNGVIDNTWGHKRVKNSLSSLFGNKVFWYIMGRYVGDGWKKNSKTGSGIVICCSDRNRKSLIDALNNIGWRFSLSSEKNVYKIFISSNECNAFVDRFGYKAWGKMVDFETLSLPADLLEGFVDGIIDSDGCFTNNRYKVATVSEQLVYGLAQCIAKVYHRPFSVYKNKREPKTVIEGRIVNQKDSYTVVWSKENSKQDKAFYENGYIWFPIKEISVSNFTGDVYNMSVEEDESYTANGCIVHNCTDISSAGQQKGLSEGSGTMSSLLWECRKAIEIKRPKYLLMENVKALTSEKFLPYLQKWLLFLESMGYSNFTKILNSKDYGVPQNRERVFVVSIYGKNSFTFPSHISLNKSLDFVLDDNVEESFYIKEDKIHLDELSKERLFVKYTRDKKVVVVGRRLSDISNTIHTSIGNGGNTDCFVFEPKIIQVGNIRNEKNFKNPQCGRVYSPFGISPTIDTMCGGQREPKILTNDYRIRKLTPRECFRLMGVSEENIDKIQNAGISKTQQYKMAGNSIVVDVLYHIFRKLFIDKEQESIQLTLF